MATNPNKKLVEQIISEAMNGKNLSLLDKVIAPNFKHHGIPNEKPGPDGFKDSLRMFFDAFPDMKINAEHIAADEDLVATRGYWTGTNKGSFMGAPPTNKTVRSEYIDFWKIKNGQAVENWVSMDFVGIMTQLGITHAPETA